jgi:co-chaperonin GroES (HSP10)
MLEYSSFQNYIVFKTDQLFEDKCKAKGLNGRELVFDPGFDPQRHSRIYGEVISLPNFLSDFPMMQEHRGVPSYHESAPFSFKHLSDVQMELKVGDRIYFHFNTMKLGNIIQEEGLHPNKTFFMKVRYDQVICAVRKSVITQETSIIPIGGYTLIDPDFESWDDILVPTYSEILGKDGQRQLKPKELWIQRKVAPEYKYLKGFVRHVGTPLRGDELEIQSGQRIWYRVNADWMVKIEGKDYFVVRQRHIIGKEVDGEFSPTRNYMLVTPIEPKASTLSPNKRHPKSGYVHTPGRSPFRKGQKVHFGHGNRTEIELKGEKLLHIQAGDVFAHGN